MLRSSPRTRASHARAAPQSSCCFPNAARRLLHPKQQNWAAKFCLTPLRRKRSLACDVCVCVCVCLFQNRNGFQIPTNMCTARPKHRFLYVANSPRLSVPADCCRDEIILFHSYLDTDSPIASPILHSALKHIRDEKKRKKEKKRTTMSEREWNVFPDSTNGTNRKRQENRKCDFAVRLPLLHAAVRALRRQETIRGKQARTRVLCGLVQRLRASC